MKKIIAVGQVQRDGSTVMDTAVPRVIDAVDVGTLTVSIMQDGTGIYVDVKDDWFPAQIRCSGIEQARRVFNGIVGAEAETLDVVVGGSRQEIELDQIPF